MFNSFKRKKNLSIEKNKENILKKSLFGKKNTIIYSDSNNIDMKFKDLCKRMSDLNLPKLESFYFEKINEKNFKIISEKIIEKRKIIQSLPGYDKFFYGGLLKNKKNGDKKNSIFGNKFFTNLKSKNKIFNFKKKLKNLEKIRKKIIIKINFKILKKNIKKKIFKSNNKRKNIYSESGISSTDIIYSNKNSNNNNNSDIIYNNKNSYNNNNFNEKNINFENSDSFFCPQKNFSYYKIKKKKIMKKEKRYINKYRKKEGKATLMFYINFFNLKLEIHVPFFLQSIKKYNIIKYINNKLEKYNFKIEKNIDIIFNNRKIPFNLSWNKLILKIRDNNFFINYFSDFKFYSNLKRFKKYKLFF